MVMLLLLLAGTWHGPAAVPTVSIGQNFTASTYNVNVVALPPDPNGAIGPQHFVELINGAFAVFDKTSGQNLKNVTDLHFWSNAGVVISPDDVTTDPRVIYDPSVGRWFASMVDASAAAADPTMNANDFLLAVSASSDPTGAWHGFLFQADSTTGYFADFPTLGVDQYALYLAGDFFHGSNSPAGPGLVVIPKTNLLAATPSISGRSWSGIMDYSARGQVLQPAICLDGSAVGQVLAVSDVGNDSNPHSNLVSFVVEDPQGPSGTLTPSTIIPTDSWTVPDNADYGAPVFVATQPDGTATLMANDARLSAKVYAVAGVLYAAHSTQLGNHIAIQWYRVRAADHTLLESGTISDPNMDLFFPCIAANESGVVAIGYNGSGPGAPISCFATIGQTSGSVTTFGSPMLLQTGATSYHGDDELLAQLLGDTGFSRWGDYNAISVDPSDANRFWTIQMYPSDGANSDVWSTQVTELIVAPQPLLAIRPSAEGVAISWPNTLAGYELQSASSLAPNASWTAVTGPVVTNAEQIVVSLPASALDQFFRLQKP